MYNPAPSWSTDSPRRIIRLSVRCRRRDDEQDLIAAEGSVDIRRRFYRALCILDRNHLCMMDTSKIGFAQRPPDHIKRNSYPLDGARILARRQADHELAQLLVLLERDQPAMFAAQMLAHGLHV